MSFAFAQARRRRKPSLTPMIDVVFLLLVFFMLVARFGQDGAITLSSGGATAFDGPPRLVDIRPDGIRLNGVALAPEALLTELAQLAPAPDDAVILRAQGGATLQDLVAAMEMLKEAGHARLVLAE